MLYRTISNNKIICDWLADGKQDLAAQVRRHIPNLETWDMVLINPYTKETLARKPVGRKTFIWEK